MHIAPPCPQQNTIAKKTAPLHPARRQRDITGAERATAAQHAAARYEKEDDVDADSVHAHGPWASRRYLLARRHGVRRPRQHRKT